MKIPYERSNFWSNPNNLSVSPRNSHFEKNAVEYITNIITQSQLNDLKLNMEGQKLAKEEEKSALISFGEDIIF